MRKQSYNLLFEINNNILSLTDVKTGFTKNWKIKVDPFCGYCYQIQKTQIKTIYEDMNDLLNELSELYYQWPHNIGFKIDFKYKGAA